jgi:hypothetical protein
VSDRVRETDRPGRGERTRAKAAAADVGPRAAGPAALPSAARTVLALQREIGNAAVTRMLARQAPTEAAAANAAQPAPAAPDWSTPLTAQATATATRTRLRTQLLPYMTGHRDPLVRNTAELFTGPNPLLTLDAITKRSDSAAQVALPTTPAWATARPHDAYFTGVTMAAGNVLFAEPTMTGTLLGTTMYLRGHNAGGQLLTLEYMAGVVTHEVSHFFVSQYGELPQTNVNAQSFDRYADEFRAYWIEYHRWGNLQGADKARAIREHLVGTAGDPNSGYSNFHAAYFAAGPNAFRRQVDALAGPIGYNLVNSIRLHRLWQLFGSHAAGTATVDAIVLAIDALPVSERREAAASSLIAKLATALGGDDAKRVRKALDQPTASEYVNGVNPARSPAIAALLAAIVSGVPDDIKRRYGALGPGDRQTLSASSAFLAYLDFHLFDAAALACVYAMISSASVDQYDAMSVFLDSLTHANVEALVSGLDGVPDYVAAALGRLTDASRWTFFSWAREGAMKQYVDVLPPRVAAAIRELLRA